MMLLTTKKKDNLEHRFLPRFLGNFCIKKSDAIFPIFNTLQTPTLYAFYALKKCATFDLYLLNRGCKVAHFQHLKIAPENATLKRHLFSFGCRLFSVAKNRKFKAGEIAGKALLLTGGACHD